MTSGPDSSGGRPVLVIAHGENSVSAMKVAEAAERVCDLVWLVDSTELTEPRMLRFLRKLGTTIDTAGMSEDEVVDALRACRPDGIIAFAEYLIPTASTMAGRLGLNYHDAAVTRRLVDKFEQRQALRDGGLPVPRFVVVPECPTSEDFETLVAGVSFPVVLKPRRGAGSRQAWFKLAASFHRLRAHRNLHDLHVQHHLLGSAHGDIVDDLGIVVLRNRGDLAHLIRAIDVAVQGHARSGGIDLDRRGGK